jgi:hypothetical protein
LKFKVYAASFFENMGTYHHYGGIKFIPEVNETTFKKILEANPLYKQNNTQGQAYQYLVKEVYPMIKDEVFKSG